MPNEKKPVSGAKARNIVIFSDGTGQRGGLNFDEERTNVYKLYRATRVAPDSSVQPNKQVAFYDAGLGTLPEGGNVAQRTYRKLYNFISQATGLGITRNIINCYAALIRLWRPGDRIFLIGFSRGAYTVRCLASVICKCGMPTVESGGKTLRLDEGATKRLAARAVKSVYQHVSSSRDEKYINQRKALAAAFRNDCQSNDPNDSEHPNAHPCFIGVFDTVASLSNTGSLFILSTVYFVLHVMLAIGLAFASNQTVGYWFGWIAVCTICAATAAYVYTHLKFAWRIPGYFFWDIIHLTTFRQKFYDQHLDPLVKYARHAISIDERRNDFRRVPWGIHQAKYPKRAYRMGAFKQIWFAGNHADIGGGYPENESRLSDIALAWMVREAAHKKLGDEKLIVDASVLRTSGRKDGMQHDETRNIVFRWAKKTLRDLVPDATLHLTVLQRFKLKEVQQYDTMAKYRPEALRMHEKVQAFYADIPLPHVTFWQRVETIYGSIRKKVRKALTNWISRKVYSLYPTDWEAKKTMNPPLKQFTLDSFVSFLGLAFLLIFVGKAIWILVVWQIFPWLREGIWYSYPLAPNYVPVTSWVGLEVILSWIAVLPITLLLTFVGVFLFWAFGLLSTKLYVWASNGANQAKKAAKAVTPAQIHN